MSVAEVSRYGQEMRRVRLELGLSQLEVAHIAGVTPETISNWERGLRQGNSPEAARGARRIIQLLKARLRRRGRADEG
jgi:transcriptional regulator with XRE-family HTH domain